MSSFANQSVQHLKLRWKVTQKRLHRFAGLISFCGVAVVLATFIVKDVLRDEEKDALSALETAEREYNLTDGIGLIGDGIAYLTDKVNSHSERERDGVAHLSATFRSLLQSQTTLNRLTGLLESLPKKEAKLVEQEFNQLSYDALKLRDTVSPISTAELDPVTDSAVALRDKVEILEIQLTKQVRKEAKKASRGAKRFTYWTYFLYPIGVFIGVLGQLAGVKSAGGE
jgi:hypothetical protein